MWGNGATAHQAMESDWRGVYEALRRCPQLINATPVGDNGPRWSCLHQASEALHEAHRATRAQYAVTVPVFIVLPTIEQC